MQDYNTDPILSPFNDGPHVREYIISVEAPTIEVAFEFANDEIRRILVQECKRYKRSYKVSGTIGCNFTDVRTDISRDFYLGMGRRFEILSAPDANDFPIDEMVTAFNTTLEKFHPDCPSGHRLENVFEIIIKTGAYKRRSGRSYIKTPYINHTIVNIHNKDSQCL